MQYTEIDPGGELTGAVRLWHLVGSTDGPSTCEPVPPDGCVEVIVHLGDPFVRVTDGTEQAQPRALLAGPGTRPVLLAPTGRVDVVGARLSPGVATALLGSPLSDVVDHIPALEDVAGRFGRDLSEEIADPRRGDDWTDVFKRRLRAHLRPPHPVTARAVARIRTTRGQISVDRLSQELGLSARQLERHFETHVGFGPKMLGRIERFQAAWRLSEACPEASLTDLAARTGYYDQSHLVRDFRRFTGEVPSRFLTTTRDLTPRFRS